MCENSHHRKTSTLTPTPTRRPRSHHSYTLICEEPDYLTNEWGVFTVRRGGVAKGEVIRVTPALYNTPQDSDLLARALKAAARRF